MEKQIHPQLLERLLLLSEAQQLKVAHWIKSTFGKSEQPTERMSIEEYNQDLEEAEARIQSGQFASQLDVDKEMALW